MMVDKDTSKEVLENMGYHDPDMSDWPEETDLFSEETVRLVKATVHKWSLRAAEQLYGIKRACVMGLIGGENDGRDD